MIDPDVADAEGVGQETWIIPVLYIDTETTSANPNEARLVELAAILDGPHGMEVFETLIKPEGFEIPWQAERIHGISTEEAYAKGVSLDVALERLSLLAAQAQGGVLVAHNLRYDLGVIGHEFRRLGVPALTPLNLLRPFCTMQSLTNRMALPGGRGGRAKYPRLSEAYRYCFGDPIPQGSHTAALDAAACRAIYRHGISQGWWSHA